ncbi:MAG: c-type cytochrome [Candidatus Rokubacteria bacterium]|nr:c-type cytochrome [Candidatus Rokubacteria bacterium]
MRSPFLRVAIFTVGLVAVFVWIGDLITRISGEGTRPPLAAVGAGTVTPEAGEAVFWGKGKCSTCHAAGSRGSSIRGPNQGASGPLGLAIGARAEERARERAKATGKPYTATDYLVESLLDPGAYVVQGYKNEMPNPMRPPIRLGADEVRAVVAYLQSLGGAVDVAVIKLPASAQALAPAATAADEVKPYLAGDPKKGEALFFDADSNAACGKCHKVGSRGGDVGPDLTQVAGTRDLRFIIESVLEPSKEIASGFESMLIITKDGQYVTGILKKEDASAIEVVDSQGRIARVPKDRIQQNAPQKTSMMPENFREILTVEEFHHLLAYLGTLR